MLPSSTPAALSRAAKSEAIQEILELGLLKNEGKIGKILVSGCLSQRYKDQLMEELPEVDGILGCGSYTDIVSAVDDVLGGDKPRRLATSTPTRRSWGVCSPRRSTMHI